MVATARRPNPTSCVRRTDFGRANASGRSATSDLKRSCWLGLVDRRIEESCRRDLNQKIPRCLRVFFRFPQPQTGA